jgi:predicted dehydrogenase
MSQISRRSFVKSGLAAGAALTLPAACSQARSSGEARSANEQISLGFISCGGRSRQLQGQFKKVDGVNFAAFCDPDRNLLARMKKEYPRAQMATDLRTLLDNKSLDAVVISTCNHWHCLAAIWAMEAGKDVYVEKPLSHSQWEGRQTVAAARKYRRVCQVGTQQRSDPMQAEIKKFLHEDKALGEIVAARVNRYGVRAAIGKRSTPLPIPSSVDYDLWLGPAQDQPIYRDNLHYDWHWDWNTGSGEMGNWGVHVLDDCRNVVFRDSVTLPKRICGGGGRVVWDDAGNTPNVHFVYFDTGSIPVVIGLANITASPSSEKPPAHPGAGSGYVVYCEGGRYEGQRGRGAAFDTAGNKIKSFKGNNGDVLHQKNFIDAVRAEDSGLLNTEVEVGHFSTGWCNLANVAFRAGGPFARPMVDLVAQETDQWMPVVAGLEEALEAHGVRMDGGDVKISKMLSVDVEAEQFVGDSADMANQFLKRQYRAPYIVPEVA